MAVRVAAQWALRGKLQSDRGYRLLSCSSGDLNAHNFEEILTRYSPGTLEELPQVTVSWIPSGEANKSYQAIAIHEFSEDGQFDLDGRRIVFTRYFCAPYWQLAEASISYQVLYENFRGLQLDPVNRPPITVDLKGRGLEVSPTWKAALGVVELLLSGSPVCIIDADRVELHNRLAFIDLVMTLLPYGFRSRMSASTWTSSTTQRHKFRLFFSNSPRIARSPDEQDHVVSWTAGPIRDNHRGVPSGYWKPGHRRPANRYFEWLRSCDQPPVAGLAKLNQQVSFSAQDPGFEQVLNRAIRLPRRSNLRALPAPKRSAVKLKIPDPTPDPPVSDRHGDVPEFHESHGPSWSNQPLLDRPSQDRQEADRQDTVEGLLISCAQLLEKPDHNGLADVLAAISNKLDNPDVQRADRRRRYWQIMIDQGLLRLHVIGFEMPLYPTLLRLAFGQRPISYEVFCQIEDMLGGPPHQPLADALELMEVSGILMQVILHEILNDSTIMNQLRAGELDVRQLIEAVVNEELRSHHSRIIFEIIIRALDDPSIQAQMPSIRATLRYYGYMAPLLQRREPDDQQYQINTLSSLLSCAFGKLDKRTAVDILSDAEANAPTLGLLAAVSLQLLDPADAPFLLREFMIGYAANTGLELYTSHELQSLYASDDQSMPETLAIEAPKPESESAERGLKHRMGDQIGDAAGKTQEKPWWRPSLSLRPQFHHRSTETASPPSESAD